MPVVEFYFDFVSPYSYVAFKLLCQLRKAWNLTVRYMPVRIQHVVVRSGNHPPGGVPAKLSFMQSDLARTAAFYNIPFAAGKDFLRVDMRMASRIVMAADDLGLDVEAIVGAIWLKFFGLGESDVFRGADWELYESILVTIVGPRACKELVALASSEAIAERLVANTNSVIEKGAFGMPTMLVTDNAGQQEFFFGSDRFHHIATFLGQDPTLPYSLTGLSKL